MNILIDWVSISSKIDTVHSIIRLLEMTEQVWELRGGYYGYINRLVFGGISIHYGGQSTVLLEMSGKGCRDFTTYGSGRFKELFDLVKDNHEDYNITRLDIACDDKDGILPLDIMADDLLNKNFVGRIRNYNVIRGSKGCTLEIGSRSSNIFIRIYDKAMERGFEEMHWVRAEIQMRDEHAYGFISQINESESNVASLYCGIFNNYFRFVIPSSDTNKRRWKTAEYWKNFIKEVERIKLLSHLGIEYNFSKLENYVINIGGNSIDTYINCVGIETLIKNLKNRKSKITSKHKKAILDYKNIVGERYEEN